MVAYVLRCEVGYGTRFEIALQHVDRHGVDVADVAPVSAPCDTRDGRCQLRVNTLRGTVNE